MRLSIRARCGHTWLLRRAPPHDCGFHRLQYAYQPVHVAAIDTPVRVVWERLASQQMHIRARAPNEQDTLSRLYAGVNFRRQHITDERIAQRDQMYIRRKKEAEEDPQEGQDLTDKEARRATEVPVQHDQLLPLSRLAKILGRPTIRECTASKPR